MGLRWVHALPCPGCMGALISGHLTSGTDVPARGSLGREVAGERIVGMENLQRMGVEKLDQAT